MLWGISTNTDPKNDAYVDQGFLVVPDGTTAAGNPAVAISLPSNGTRRDDGMCFSVPLPASGSYKVTMHEQRSKAFGTLNFLIP